MIPEQRSLTPAEIEVILTTLRVAPEVPVDEGTIARVPNLQVIGRCGCGCATIEFELPAEHKQQTVLANALGETPNNGTVGVLVWGRADAITFLEIYDLGAGEDDTVLPVPTTLRSMKDDPNVIHLDPRNQPK